MPAFEDAVTRRSALALAGAGALTAAGTPAALAASTSLRGREAPPVTDPGIWHGDLWYPYVGNGTVFTRSVASMPLATNSAAMATRMPTLPNNPYGVITSLNTTSYNIPTYVVDSTVAGCPFTTMTASNAAAGSTLAAHVNGRIPLPPYATPAGGGDSSMAVYDRGSGIMREYFLCRKQSDGTWTAATGGYYVAAPRFTNLPTANYSMELTEGSSAVVAMLNPLLQVGISEARRGEIGHALDFTISNARSGVVSWPAKQSDGTDSNVNTPAEGQWFRFPPTLNLDTLGLRPFTLLLARAVQKYGGMAGDKNLFCHAFNVEHPATEIQRTGSNPWETDIKAKYGSLDVGDFPWARTQWAPVSWGKPA
ncbi:hypothetical protein [Allobranchiibius sp. CTAmp26]|uniref:hypothetical protein n=1 Tax=Allobranchiibius sp. CTAmp26 TaxID=2815214 RepID=UPI001AA11571|nr:hypothetical protein [Allobranchiibius sp. CTAmp26]MBO1753944.1 hypothetical protein [Allobranchiibius sp. CTAmp26]